MDLLLEGGELLVLVLLFLTRCILVLHTTQQRGSWRLLTALFIKKD